MADEIEMVVGDVSDIDARVYARFRRAAGGAKRERVTLRGTLRGPFCVTSRTLPAEYVFREVGDDTGALAEAVVPDPCTWSPELPHTYRADVQAWQGERLVAEFHGTIGLRRAGK